MTNVHPLQQKSCFQQPQDMILNYFKYVFLTLLSFWVAIIGLWSNANHGLIQSAAAKVAKLQTNSSGRPKAKRVKKNNKNILQGETGVLCAAQVLFSSSY